MFFDPINGGTNKVSYIFFSRPALNWMFISSEKGLHNCRKVEKQNIHPYRLYETNNLSLK